MLIYFISFCTFWPEPTFLCQWLYAYSMLKWIFHIFKHEKLLSEVTSLLVLNMILHNLSNNTAVFAQELNSKEGPSFGTSFPSNNSILSIIPDKEQQLSCYSLPIGWGFLGTCIYSGQSHLTLHTGMLSFANNAQLAMKIITMWSFHALIIWRASQNLSAWEEGENEASLRLPMISSNLFRVASSFNRADTHACMLISLVDFFLELPGHNVIRSHDPMSTKNSTNDNDLLKNCDVSGITALSIHCLGIDYKKSSLILSHGSINADFSCLRPDSFLAQNSGTFPDQF